MVVRGLIAALALAPKPSVDPPIRPPNPTRCVVGASETGPVSDEGSVAGVRVT